MNQYLELELEGGDEGERRKKKEIRKKGNVGFEKEVGV